MPASGMHAAWNIGYFYLKHTALAAMLHWQQKCADNPTLWDQNLFKDVLKIGGLQTPPRDSPAAATRLFRGYNRTLAIGILPVRTFCSGHTYFIQRMPQRAKVEPYSVRRALGRAAATHMHCTCTCTAHAPHMHRTCTARAGAHDLPVLWRRG